MFVIALALSSANASQNALCVIKLSLLFKSHHKVTNLHKTTNFTKVLIFYIYLCINVYMTMLQIYWPFFYLLFAFQHFLIVKEDAKQYFKTSVKHIKKEIKDKINVENITCLHI
jgi:type III secretory pathway component EscU